MHRPNDQSYTEFLKVVFLAHCCSLSISMTYAKSSVEFFCPLCYHKKQLSQHGLLNENIFISLLSPLQPLIAFKAAVDIGTTRQEHFQCYGRTHRRNRKLDCFHKKKLFAGSDTRPTLTEGGGREHLIVLELCPTTLRARLERAPLSWMEFATIAHGLASALAHLHTASEYNYFYYVFE